MANPEPKYRLGLIITEELKRTPEEDSAAKIFCFTHDGWSAYIYRLAKESR